MYWWIHTHSIISETKTLKISLREDILQCMQFMCDIFFIYDAINGMINIVKIKILTSWLFHWFFQNDFHFVRSWCKFWGFVLSFFLSSMIRAHAIVILILKCISKHTHRIIEKLTQMRKKLRKSSFKAICVMPLDHRIWMCLP